MKVLPTLKADAVFLSPPWGGPAYQDSQTFDLHSMIPAPLTALEMFRAARAVTPNVVFFLPRNVDAAQVAGLPAAAAALKTDSSPNTVNDAAGVGGREDADADEKCELEKQFLNGKLKTSTAYFGEDIVTVGKVKGAKESVEGGDRALTQTLGEDAGTSASSGVGGGEVVTGRALTGRHVRFSDDGEVEEELRDGSANMGCGGRDREGSNLPSQERENALYEAWMTPAGSR